MPYSYSYFKEDIKNHFKSVIHTSIKILDVGPGAGTYSDLLTPIGYKLDCLEIWQPYVNEFKLTEKYGNVMIGNISLFDFNAYDYIILGDVLEHINTQDAKDLVTRILLNRKKCLIAVPYRFEQGTSNGNVYETHLQPELTHDLFMERYPGFNILYGNNDYGYYINYL